MFIAYIWGDWTNSSFKQSDCASAPTVEFYKIRWQQLLFLLITHLYFFIPLLRCELEYYSISEFFFLCLVTFIYYMST